MLKRLYSKRSGFTLVEIIVAFAVFAIMASMIAQILSLSVSARNSNNQYARELARQEKMLTVIEKSMDNYNATDKTGDYSIAFTKGGAGFTMGYQIKAADPNAADDGEGINYFLSPVDYKGSAGVDYPDPGSNTPSDIGGMSQADRMDTRITGTAGIGGITIHKVIKDEFDYPDDSPFKLEPGHTRYFIEVSASSVDVDGNQTLAQDNIPYSQYKLFFFSDELDAAKSAIVYDKDKNGGYTKDVYKEAIVLNSGHIDKPLTGSGGVVETGLTESNTSSGSTTDAHNAYTVQSYGNNSIRIGTPFTTDWSTGKPGVKFNDGVFTRFYVEFVGDPHLTRENFGHNVSYDESGNPVFRACPEYKDEYNDDGTPTYEELGEGQYHPSIYGAYNFTRHYKNGSTPETPEETE